MGSGIPLDSSAAASTVLEGICYGISLPLFGWTLWTLHQKRAVTHSSVDRRMFTIACLLFVISTAHIIIDIIRVEEGLVLYRDTFPGGPLAFFADVREWTFVYGNVVYIMQTMLGDGVVIYRCHMVWQSYKLILLPTILWFGVAVSGFGACYAIANSDDSSDVFAKYTASWITAFFSFTLATNLIGTSLLAYRIWIVDRSVARHRVNKSPLASVLRTILDAGIIYSVTLMATLTCFAIESNGQFFVLNMNTPIISNTFFMVIIRIGVPYARSQQGHTTFNQRHVTNNTSDGLGSTGEFPMQEVKIHITKLVETSREGNTTSTYVANSDNKDLHVDSD